MIGAIKRRWKSKKAKVLHKGNDLSSSSDSCPTSRGFVDGPEDFEKMIKPPSPRQVHPVLEKGDIKFGQFHNLHHLLQQNNGNGGNGNNSVVHHHSYILQQPPTGKKKSSTLPAADDCGGGGGGGIGGGSVGGSGGCGGDKGGSQDGCHFIRVNSGRIELVSKESWKTSSTSAGGGGGGGDQSGNCYAVIGERYNNGSAAERFLNRHLKNDVRHSWCGSAIRSKNVDSTTSPHQLHNQSKRLSEDQQHGHGQLVGGVGFRGGLGSNNNNNRIYPQEDIPATTTVIAASDHHHHYHLVQSDFDDGVGGGVGGGGDTMIVTSTSTTTAAATTAHQQPPAYSLALEDLTSSSNNGKGLLSPLRERLAAIEELTTSLQSWQTTEKTEYEKCVSDLANQVSRAVALQQMMKSEVEKLQQRVVDLENHNKAMATMIIPTLMKLHDTVGIKDGPQLKSIEPAPPAFEDDDNFSLASASPRTMTMTTSDIRETSRPQSQRNLIKSQEELKLSQSSPSPCSSSDNNDPSSCQTYINNLPKSPSHFIAVVSTTTTTTTAASPSFSNSSYYSAQNASSQMKTICYEQSSNIPESSVSTPPPQSSSTAALLSNREKILERTASSDLNHPHPPSPQSTMTRSSPVKAPRTSKIVAAAAAAAAAASQQSVGGGGSASTGIPKLNGSSTGNICGSSLSRSNSSCNSRNNQSPSLSKPIISNDTDQSHQIMSSSAGNNPNNLITSLESSITSSTSSSSGGGQPINSEMSNSTPTNTTNTSAPFRSSCRSSSNTSRTSLSGIPRMSSPCRTATVTKIPCGQQTTGSSNNNCPTPKPARRVSDRSSSPHGSKLPVRKASFISTLGTSATATTTSTTPSSPGGSNSSRHPAASSKSLPANSNMGTAFQNMSKSGSGPQGNKHSKSTFGFASSKNSKVASNSTRTNATSNNSTTTSTSTKPIKLTSTALNATGGIGGKVGGGATGKDEGYSTMSSEALAEQEHHLRQNNSLEKTRTSALSRNSTFSVKSKNAMIPPSSANVSSPTSNKIVMGSLTLSRDPTQPEVVLPATTTANNRNNIHKSNTFNTFREVSRRVPADDYEDEDNSDPATVSSSASTRRSRSHSKNNSATEKELRNSCQSQTSGCSSGQFTSLPNSSSSASSSPSKAKYSGGATPKRSAKSSHATYNKDRITATTRMTDGNIVRIVRGSPYSVRLYGGDDSGDDMEDEEDPSSSTILWEDSDDSDILFLPLEVSPPSVNSSKSTLVPQPQSSGESRSYYSSWGRGSSSMGTCSSTLEKESSNSSVHNPTNGGGAGVVVGMGGGGNTSCNSNTFSRRAYPLRRTKGEVTVDVLLIKNGGGIGQNCSDGGGIVTEGLGDSDLVNNQEESIVIINNDDDDEVDDDPSSTTIISPPITDEMEERALIEKWMQLEEVRNEQVQGGEQWAWDWDGVERTYTRVLRNAASQLRRVPMGRNHQHQDHLIDEDDDLLDEVDLILENSTLLPSPPTEVLSIEERNKLNEQQQQQQPCSQFDSNTWTKSKSRKKKDETANGEKKKGNNSQDASPEKVRRGPGPENSSMAAVTTEQILLVLEGERDIESEAGLLIKRGCEGGGEDADDDDGEMEESILVINLDESGRCLGGDGGEEADGEEDEAPPVIEFTPEFYRLANFGSNLSFSDNESPQSSTPQSPKVAVTGGNNNKLVGTTTSAAATKDSKQNSPKKKKHTRRSHSTTVQNATAAPPPVIIQTCTMNTDDKISQTDFSCSSLENMSSVSSNELSAECRNCLEIIKKLVGQADTATEEEAEDQEISSQENYENGALCSRKGEMKEKDEDLGSYATTWISVPKGLPTAEVDRILEILSSSESEGVLSPSK